MCDKDNAATDGTNAACGPDFSSDMVSYEFDFDEDDIIEEIAPAESAAFGEAHKNHVKDCALNESVPDTAKSCGNDYDLKNDCLSENVFFDGESDDELIVEVTPVVLYSSSLFEISEDECDALLAGEEDDLELIADISFGADELNFETSDKNF